MKAFVLSLIVVVLFSAAESRPNVSENFARLEWAEFYSRVFGMNVDFDAVSIPSQDSSKPNIVLVPAGMTWEKVVFAGSRIGIAMVFSENQGPLNMGRVKSSYAVLVDSTSMELVSESYVKWGENKYCRSWIRGYLNCNALEGVLLLLKTRDEGVKFENVSVHLSTDVYVDTWKHGTPPKVCICIRGPIDLIKISERR